MFSRRFCAAFIVVFVTLSCLGVRAQSTYGAIVGSVTDSSGAAITDANVTLTNVGTSEKRTQSSGSDGLFTFVNLFPGQYRIDVEKPGFKHFVRTGLTVEVQQSTHIDAALQVGEVSQVVEVTAETPLLQSETSSLGTVVGTREANELPLNGRNIYNLATVTPSVIPQGNTEGTVVGKNPFDFANYQIGGAFANEAAEYLDGQPLNIGYINLPLEVPTQDSIGEFKVQYNNLGPEWGKFAGGVINMSTKSGTNTWHGTAYEYLRNKVFNANEYLHNNSAVNGPPPTSNQPPPFTQNQFGAAIGGPVLKNKTFAFFSYEGFRLRTGTVFTTTVPTLAERGGNFAELCSGGFVAGVCKDKDSSGKTIHQLYDPLSVNLATGLRQPIPNNDISGLINPTSAFLLNKLIEQPNMPGTNLNFSKATSTGGDTDAYVGRVDQTINSKQTIFGRFAYWKLLSLAQDPFGTGLCKDRCAENTRSKSIAIGYNYAISPNTIANLNIQSRRLQSLRG